MLQEIVIVGSAMSELFLLCSISLTSQSLKSPANCKRQAGSK